MALIESGPLRGFYRPDYEGGSLVDLMASLIRARGGRSTHHGLGRAFEQTVANARHVVLLIVDGLGVAQRERYLDSATASPFLGRHPYRELSSVFPATTAAAVTTLMSGASPAEHGILGWFLNLHDLGLVSAILPTATRTEVPIVGPDFPLAEYLAIPQPVASIPGPRIALTHRFILESRFSGAVGHWTATHATESLTELETRLGELVRRDEPSYCYAYWPAYDGLSHQHGPGSAAALKHLAEIDAMLDRLGEMLLRHNAMLLVTADHGFVDTPPAHQIDLSRIEGLYDDLATLPSGDARAVSLFVRPARLESLRSRLTAFADHFAVIEGEALLEAGVFGPGIHHPALFGRVGDLILLAKGHCALNAPLRGSAPHRMSGNHGGMTEPEMRIPLFQFGP